MILGRHLTQSSSISINNRTILIYQYSCQAQPSPSPPGRRSLIINENFLNYEDELKYEDDLKCVGALKHEDDRKQDNMKTGYNKADLKYEDYLK